jgi:Family of unknown function (DUF6263)
MTPFAPLFVAALLAPAQADTPLTWKLAKGDVFYAKSSNVIKQTIEVLGNKMNQEQDQTTYQKYTVKAADKDGYVIEQLVLKSVVEGNLPGTADIAKKMKGVTLTFTMNAKFEVKKVDGYDKFLEALVGDNEAAKKQIASMLSEDTLKQGVSDLFGLTPAKAVKVGDTWKKETKMSMGPVGDFKMDTDYKYASAAAAGDKVTWTAKATYSAPKAAGDGPFTITKGELKSDKLEGEYAFDSKTGRMKAATTRAHFAGKLTISVNGMEVEMELDQNLTTTTTLSDKNLADD